LAPANDRGSNGDPGERADLDRAMTALGTTDAGEPLSIEVQRLIGTHLGVIANSGGGKSGLLRRLLETTHGRIQHFVLDPEDDFYTMRERFDYVIAGGDGADIPATIEGAANLALGALTHGFSLIVQLNDFGDKAPVFVARFLEGLMRAPREHWHPLLVVIDEAQRFVSPKVPTVAQAAVADLVNRGRKRGFTAALASLRLADAIAPEIRAMLNNWLLGRVGQTLDRNAMADQLGFTAKEGREKLRGLEQRQFWALGPALSSEPVLFRVGDTETTIVEVGQARLPTPPAPEALRAILSGLVVPSAEPDGADDLDAKLLRGAEVRQLREARDAFEQRALRAEDMLGEFISAHGLYEQALNGFADTLKYGHAISFSADQHLKEHGWTSPNEIPGNRPGGGPSGDAGQTAESAAPVPAAPRATAPAPAARTATEKAGGGNASPAALAIVELLDRVNPARLTWSQAATMTGRKASGGNFNSARKWIRESGRIVEDGEFIRSAAPEPVGLSREEAILLWKSVLTNPAPRMIEVLAFHPASAQVLAGQLEIQPRGGNWNNGLAQLRRNGVAELRDGKWRLADPLPGQRP